MQRTRQTFIDTEESNSTDQIGTMAELSSTQSPFANVSQSVVDVIVLSKDTNCTIEDGFLALSLPIFYIIICVIGLLGNLLALWVFFFNQRKSTSISIYMKHLAVADLLLLLCLPFRIAYHIGEYKWMVRCYFCKIIGTFFYINMYASIVFLGLISLDRYLKITKPLLKFRIHSVKWSSGISKAVWLTTILFMLPFVVVSSLKSNETKCFHYKNQSVIAGAMNLTAVMFIFILSLLFLVSYAKIAVKLYNISEGKKKQQIRKVSTRAIIKTSIVLAIYIVCFIPYHIVRVPYVLSQMEIISSCHSKQFLHVANELVLCLSALNSCLDPVIYFFLSNSFRRVIIYTIKGRFSKTFPKANGTRTSFKSITDV
ncbi:G protein-coupled receptor 34 like [Rhincodon typus]|uniref:G protein-coupled receptor 34 like n=1 Tax=Rhincodon typus TaxID=259920 RepID=UPI00202DE38F|nr:G protein-coupled receptor 34 like [Rhincodon typus]XP_048461102.1 G protein-coupled receptor 34 like [Rhincodon typus]XP_048461103.1 G protein-coupled receptor 34 like [Rhincodon typus]